jgi:predicted SprT family Zn-dependent metalloprotease
MPTTKPRVMTETEARKQARDLLTAHGLGHWKVTFGTARGRAGTCYHQTRTIRLSRVLLASRTYEGSLDTIRHEVAHALVGPGQGHGPVWKKAFRSLGGGGNRCWSDRTLVENNPNVLTPYVYTCSACTKVLGRTRGKMRNLDRSVSRCCKKVIRVHKSDPAGNLTRVA